MALIAVETWESGEGELGRDAKDHYALFVIGDPNPQTDNADDPLVATIFAVQFFSTISAFGNPITSIPRKRVAPGIWLFEANYVSSTENRQEGDASFSFSVGGGTQHITHAKKTIGTYIPQSTSTSGTTSSATAPDFQGSINVTDDGVDGVDVNAKASAFEVTFYISPKNMTPQYADLLDNFNTTVNSDTVTLNIDGLQRTYASGELLIDSATGSKRRGDKVWEVNIKGKVSRNATNITIGGTTDSEGNVSGAIVIPQKNGWDLVWVRSGPAKDAGSKTRVQAPQAATVVQVYDYGPLSPLFAPSGYLGAGSNSTDPGGLSWQSLTYTSGDDQDGSGVVGTEGAGDGDSGDGGDA